jgi:hypothetical protein
LDILKGTAFVATAVTVTILGCISPARSKDLNHLLNSSSGSTFVSQSVTPPEPVSPAKNGAPEVKAAAEATAFISGLVTDFTKEKRVADARVVLSKVGEEHKRFQTETNEQGAYAFNNVEAGQWKITVSAKDMLSHDQELDIVSGEIKTLNVPLESAEAVDILRVTGKRTLIHPESIASETNLDSKFLYQYKTGNDLRDLITSTPGVMNDSYGNIISRGEHNAVNYELDGVVIPEAAGVLQQTQATSPRSLQSVTVDIGGYEASDGGGPLGAVAHMKSLPILSKPNFNIGQQIGGPLAGSIFFDGSGAFSQTPGTFGNKLRFSSSGSFRDSSYNLAPPVKDYVNNNGFQANIMSKLEYIANEKDTFRLTLAINEAYMQVPTSQYSYSQGVYAHQHDGQNYLIATWIHKFNKKFVDEGNLNILNGLYYENYVGSNAFDPQPNFNNGQPLQSLAATARRFNYVFSAQGNLLKNYKNEHHFKAGFLTELRPEHTLYNATYYNADLTGTLQNIAAGVPTPAYGAVLSPFTNAPAGPQFQGNVGKYNAFRWVQSAFFQDKYTPQNGFWKRLTLDAGVRFDMQHSVDGNALALAQTIASIPGVQPFALGPYQKQTITDAQVSGRYGATFVPAKNTVLRASYSDLFMPNPNDYFITPYQVTGAGSAPNAGVYNGTPRPLHATRGHLFDTSVERQFGPRFVTRTNLFYKYITNFGDSGVVGNLPIYNRLTNSAQDAYGVESRVDLKPSKDGYGFNGFLSNTVQVAHLRGTKTPSGGFYATPTPPFMEFPDHDRRLSSVAGVGYKTRSNFWMLFTAQVQTGLQDERDPTVSGPHPQRTPVITTLAFSAGYKMPKKLVRDHRYLPTSMDIRVDNLLNQRFPVNLGSPFQGTRFNLPLRALASCNWQLGPEETKLSSNPAPKIGQSASTALSDPKLAI